MKTLLKTAAAAALIAGGALVAAGAFAHPHPEGEADGKTKKVVIIERVGGDGKGHPKGEARMHGFKIHGGDLANCEGGEKLVDESAGDDKQKTKIIICNKGEANPAERAKRLEQALSRIESNEHLSAEHKAKIAASLRAAIDRARSAN